MSTDVQAHPIKKENAERPFAQKANTVRLGFILCSCHGHKGTGRREQKQTAKIGGGVHGTTRAAQRAIRERRQAHATLSQRREESDSSVFNNADITQKCSPVHLHRERRGGLEKPSVSQTSI